MTEILGMHWTLAATIVCLILMTADLFLFNGGVLTFLADILFTLIILHFIPTNNLLLQIFFGMLVMGFILWIHFWVYRKFVLYFINNILAPQKSRSNNDILIGKIGKLCVIEDRAYIYVEDEHIPCVLKENSALTDIADKKATVISWKNSEELLVSINEGSVLNID